MELVLKFGKNLRPDKLFILGDFMDMYSISKFDRNPERVTNLQTEFNQGREILERIVTTIMPNYKRWVTIPNPGYLGTNNGDVKFMEGNHEDRLRKFIWNNPVLSGCIDIKDKLGIKDLGIDYYGYGKNFVYKDRLIYTHGNKINKFSGYTAKNMLDDFGMSVIFGHTHRLGSHYRTDYGGAKEAVENGCLCDKELAMEWFRKEVINWQSAISVISWIEDRFNIHEICIPKDKFILYGKSYYTL